MNEMIEPNFFRQYRRRKTNVECGWTLGQLVMTLDCAR